MRCMNDTNKGYTLVYKRLMSHNWPAFGISLTVVPTGR